MRAFSNLKRGVLVTNKVTINTEPSLQSISWWNGMTDNQKADVIMKHHPACMQLSSLARFALFTNYNKNPDKLFNLEKLCH